MPALLERDGTLCVWHDRKIPAGQSLDDSIDQNLRDAEIVLFFISADFLASEYCVGIELKKALESHALGLISVVPIIVRPCDWIRSPLGKLMALPQDAKAVASWPSQDDAWTDVIKGLVRVLVGLPKIAGEQADLHVTGLDEGIVAELDRLVERTDSAYTTAGLPTGLHELDMLTDGFAVGDLVVVSSASNIDRFDLALTFSRHSAVIERLPVLIFTPEPTDSVFRRLIAQVGRISPESIKRGCLTDEEWPRLTESVEMLREGVVDIVDSFDATLPQVEKAMREFSSKYGVIGICIVDCLDQLRGTDFREKLKGLKKLARDHKTVVLATHSLFKDPLLKIDPRPVISELYLNADLQELLDWVIFIHVDSLWKMDDEANAELILRGKYNRLVTTINVMYDRRVRSFGNVIKHKKDIVE